MNELMYERKVWNVYTNSNTILLTPFLPVTDFNFKSIHTTQLQDEVHQLIEVGQIEIDRDNMECGVLKFGLNEFGCCVVVQYILSKNTLDNQSNV